MLRSSQYESFEEITVSTNQKYLDSFTFADCLSLKRIFIKGDVRVICANAIVNCPNLEELFFSSKVTDVTPGFISGPHKLSKLSVDPANPVYSDFNGSNLIIDVSNKRLVLGCHNSMFPTDFDLKYIGDNAFSGNTLLTEVIIPHTVKHLQQNAFSGCTAITRVEIPDNITKLESGVFQDCTNLTYVKFGKGLRVLKNTGVDGGQFDNCVNLQHVEFENKYYMNTVVGNTNESDDESWYNWSKVDVSNPQQNAINFLSKEANWCNLEFRDLPKAGLALDYTELDKIFVNKGEGAVDVVYNIDDSANLGITCHVFGDDTHDDNIIHISFQK